MESWVEKPNTPVLHHFHSARLQPRPRSFEPRIEDVAQSVAEQIYAQDGDKDAEAGEKRQPPGGADIDARVGQHGAPSGDIRRHADAEKAQARFGDDRRRHGEGADDERSLNEIRNNVARDDLAVARAQTLRRGDEIAAAQGKSLAAHDPTVGDPALRHERQNQIEQALA